MSPIRYLIVSDLHLGASNSILTMLSPDAAQTLPDVASPLVRQLGDCLQCLAALSGDSPAQLVLNGDFLELALAGTNAAGMTFQRFLESALAPPGRFRDEVYCLPGNHDHHLWNLARETQYVDNYLSKLPPGAEISPEYVVTNMFLDDRLKPVPAHLVNALGASSRLAAKPSFLTVYPNLALLSRDRERCVVIHHGHYVESIYSLISRLTAILFPETAPPREIWDLESDNGAWIDFFWSALGRSGASGKDVELFYDKMQSEAAFDQILDNLARAAAPGMPPRWGWLSAVKRPLVLRVLRATLGKVARREVLESGSPLSEDAASGLKRYLERYVHREILRGNGGRVPPDLTFVFGHTHKPFEDQRRFEGYPGPIKVLNSGGWVVDTPEPDALHGGAVVVVDDELNAASVRMYQETPDAAASQVRIATATGAPNPLSAELERLVARDPAPWSRFAAMAAEGVAAHRRNLLDKIASRTGPR